MLLLKLIQLFVYLLMVSSKPDFYTLSLHDALPICVEYMPRLRPLPASSPRSVSRRTGRIPSRATTSAASMMSRSEEHTSELQSPVDLVCRLLLEKKNKTADEPINIIIININFEKSG